MKRLLLKGLCLSLGLSALPASAQELNFRAVAPRPAAASTGDFPITLSRPVANDSSILPIFRGKVQDDGSIIVPVDLPRMQTVNFVQKDAPRLSPLPQGAPMEFAAPPPQLIAPPPGAGVVHTTPGTVVNDGIVTDGVLSEGVVPTRGGSRRVASVPVSTSGCACSSGGFSLFDGLIAEDPIGSCGMSCSTCGHDWHPLQRIHDFFACGCNSGCCDPRSPLWFRGEYLLWNVTQQNVPPLATQFAGGPGNFANLPIGAGSTTIYDNNNINNAIQNGVRLSMGFWFPRHNDWGMDASYFYLGNRTGTFTNTSDGSIATGRPFINNNPASPAFNQNDAQIVAATNPDGTRVPGTLDITTSSQLWSVEANLRRKLCCGPNYWFDGLIGYRHLSLSDYVSIAENIGPRSNGAGVSAGNTIVRDYFGTNNIFNGVQVGIEAEWRFRPRLTLGGTFKVASGNMHQSILIDGTTTINNGNFNGNAFGSQTQPGGLLAQGTNNGTHAVDRFVVIPELGVKLGWDITQHWRFYAGYNILYVSSVMRAGEQIDTRVNTSQNAFAGVDANGRPNGTRGVLTPGSPATPTVLYRTNEFWAQGVSLGLEYRY